MCRLVGLLRGGSEDEPGLAPAPGLGDLHRLVAEVVAAGIVVEVHAEGPMDKVPPGPALAAYRIVQEALTNAVRHNGAVKAELTVTVTDDELFLSVTNEAPGPGASTGPEGGGMSMVGMKERVLLYEGTMEAGPAPGGGYRVQARLPLSLGNR